MLRSVRVVLGPDWGSWGLIGASWGLIGASWGLLQTPCVFRFTPAFSDGSVTSRSSRSTILSLFTVVSRFHAIRPDPQIHDPMAICKRSCRYLQTSALPHYTSRSTDSPSYRSRRQSSCRLRRFGLPWPHHQSSRRFGLRDDSSRRFGLLWPQRQSSCRFSLLDDSSAPVLAQIRPFVAPAPVLTQIRSSRCGHADSAFRGPRTSPHADSVFSMCLHRTPTYQRNSHGDRSGDKLLTENVMN